MAYRYSISQGDEFGVMFTALLQDFENVPEEGKTFTSPTLTMYDTVSDRSSSPSSTSGTAVDEVTFDGWNFKSLVDEEESDDSDSDDESDDGDVPSMDLEQYEVREDGNAYLVTTNEDGAYSDASPEDEELPFLPVPVDYAHTSVPPISPTTRLPSPPRLPSPQPSYETPPLLLGPDLEVDQETDAAHSDDEYCPSPILNPRKRPSSSRTPARAPKKQRLSPPTTSFPPSSSKRVRAAPPSRNRQAGARELAALDANDFRCPVCTWVQENRRKPDFVRHLQTHTRPDQANQYKGWWCKGVRLEDLDEFNEAARTSGRKMISPDMEHKTFQDHIRIGGCLLNFSRRDALKRHLDNAAMPCAGFACKATDES